MFSALAASRTEPCLLVTLLNFVVWCFLSVGVAGYLAMVSWPKGKWGSMIQILRLLRTTQSEGYGKVEGVSPPSFPNAPMIYFSTDPVAQVAVGLR
jgi:hypothetical protein